MDKKILWYNIPVKLCFKLLKSRETGLNKREVNLRLKKFGYHKLPEERRLTWFEIFLAQFKNPLVYILVIAAAITLMLKEYIDLAVILVAVLINILIGFSQEYKADATLWQLKKLVQLKAKVIREGLEHEINIEELVPGDIIILEAGDQVPADARVIEAINLKVNEAALTGESVPSIKVAKTLEKGLSLADRENMVYMGTTVEQGRGRGLITATGLETQLGKITALVKETPREITPLQKKLAVFSKTLGLILILICLVIFIFGYFRGRSVFELFLTTVALAVAAIPEGLPASVAVVLAIGMRRILKKNGLVRRMVSAETLGATTVICTDKTGTLTEGKMRVSHIVTSGKEIAEDDHKVVELPGLVEEESHLLALEIGLLCNNAFIENPDEELEDWLIRGEAMEQALLLAAVQAGLDKRELEKKLPRTDEIPFDAEKKFMATLHRIDKNTNIAYIKGAPETVLEMSAFASTDGGKEKLDSQKKKILKLTNEKLTRKGLRVLAVGYRKQDILKDGKKNLAELCQKITFVGFIALKDPLRREAKETLSLCYKAGLRPVLITGDHKFTAQAIFEELGFPVKEERILEGFDLDKISDEELQKKVKNIDVYARVEPKHKLRIIDAWQARGEVVAMTGDGVNDAPALKTADIGVALGSGTDVAKETSDLILMDDNLSTLVAAVEEGRIIFENTRKVILFLLIDSFTEIILIGGSLFLGLPLPLLAAQILWVNLVEDTLPDIALALEPGEKDVMKDLPRKLSEPILNFEMKTMIFIVGIIADTVLLFLFWWLLGKTSDLNYIRTIIFVAVGVNSLFYVFSCRSFRYTIFNKNPFSNKYLLGAVFIGFVLVLLGVYCPVFQIVLRTTPLASNDWILPIFLAFGQIILIEVIKKIFIVNQHKKIL